MKPRMALLLVLSLTLLLSGCEQLFTNVFKAAGLGQVNLARIDTSSVASIEEYSSSPSFFEQLAGDDVAKAAILETLAADTENNDSQILGAAIELETSPAAAVADSFVAELPGVFDDINAGTGVEMGAVLGAVLPDTIDLTAATPPAEFQDIVDGFVNAAAYFEQLATNLENSGDPIVATAGLQPEDIAYYALVSLAIASVVPVDADMTLAEALWAAIQYDPESVDPSPITFDSSILDPANSVGASYTILQASGLDIAALAGGN